MVGRQFTKRRVRVEAIFFYELVYHEDLDEILALADRIAVIFEGRIMGIINREKATPETIGLLMAGVQEGA